MGILNFGSLNIDKVYKVSHFVKPGETIAAKSYSCFPGGKGLNQSVAVAKAGEKIFHAGTIGNDGEFLREILKESGADDRYLRTSDTVTGNAIIQVADNGENCIILFGGSNLENTKEYIDEVLIHFGENDILLLQNEISNLDYLLLRASEKRMRVMLNPSPINEDIKKMDLSGVTWLILNEVEGEELTGENVPEKILEVLSKKYSCKEIILTLGKKGSMHYENGVVNRQECITVKTVDTTAAGDTFTGYFLAMVSKNVEAKVALEIASYASAIAVGRAGASVSIPFMEEVEMIRSEKNN